MLRPSALVAVMALVTAGLGAACAPCCPSKEALPPAWSAAPPAASAAPTAPTPTTDPPASAAPDPTPAPLPAASAPAASGAASSEVAATAAVAPSGAAPPGHAAGAGAPTGAAHGAPAPGQPQVATGDAVAPGAPTSEPPVLLDAAGQPLPQTDARPASDSPWLARGAALLLDAIAHDDPERARAFFFPVTSYELVKAIERPAADWRSRLWRLFVRDVHALHRKHGAALEGAKLVGVSIPESKVRWMKPGAEGNKLGYFRVLRSRLTFRAASGEEGSVELTSLISWRGEWYLVHLSGFS